MMPTDGHPFSYSGYSTRNLSLLVLLPSTIYTPCQAKTFISRERYLTAYRELSESIIVQYLSEKKKRILLHIPFGEYSGLMA